MSKNDFNRIAIFGMGLLGGSICKDLRNYSNDIELHVYGRNPDKIKKVLNEGFVDYIGDIKKPYLKNIDLIIVCLPVVASIELISNLLNNPDLGNNSLVIDVGSIKEAILNSVEKSKSAGRFIGCHPMAGSDKDGYANSRAGLFKDAPVIITPNKYNKEQDINRIISFWTILKSKTVVCPADLHDLIISFTSYMPHLLACLIVENYFEISRQSMYKDVVGNKPGLFTGSGFRDVTRISYGSPDIWADISILNKENIVKSIDLMIDKLGSLKEIMNSENNSYGIIKSFFKKIKEYKQTLDSE